MLLARLPWHISCQKAPLRALSTKVDEVELIFPEPPTSNHHDLPSFLKYASRTNMDIKSTTYTGTRYEYTTQQSLQRLGMSLQRIGGRSDYGIDLLGTWKLPMLEQPLKIIVQCKALARKVDPAHARELEGAFVGAPPGWRGLGVLGLLVSKMPASKGVREAIGRSRLPMGYVLCGADGTIQQMLWNKRANQEGLDGVSVGVKYVGGDQSGKEIVLLWKDNIIPG